jgi:hypothetical protein
VAIDGKYGRVEFPDHPGHIPDDEPVVVFRGRDAMLLGLLADYHQLCREAGSPERHLEMIRKRTVEIGRWQADHPDQVRVPDSESSRAWLGEEV